jgi:hypothetical protein
VENQISESANSRQHSAVSLKDISPSLRGAKTTKQSKIPAKICDAVFLFYPRLDSELL